MANRYSKALFLMILCVVCLLIATTTNSHATETRGIKVVLKSGFKKSQSVPLYKGSYALLVGVSNYSAGWPLLESIPGEVDKVELFFKERGFHVTKVIDPDAVELKQSYENFIGSYGLEKENRLLFFFSGHGYTRQNGKKGYLVPVDAPDPGHDLKGFLKKSLGMNQVLSWARDIESKHALFLFDSCFSGTIFKQKSRITPPSHITRLTLEPVRQFITAGSAGEEVPANSTFTPAFIDALRYGLADLNKDQYVSATELGLYLQSKVPQHTEQNPQFGKISDYDLSRGDFIFMTDSTLNPSTAAVPPQTTDNSPPQRSNTPGQTENRPKKVSQGKPGKLDVKLAPVQPEGTLTVSCSPSGALIEITEFNEPYRDNMQIPAGSYTLNISKAGYQPMNRQIHIMENENYHLNILLRRSVKAQKPKKTQSGGGGLKQIESF